MAGVWAAFEAAVSEAEAENAPDADGEVTVWITAERTDDVDNTDSLDLLPRETPAERDARIVASYHDDVDNTTLAAEFGIHRITVLRALRRAGIEPRAPALDASRVHDVRAFYEAGHTIERTARHYGVSRGTIYRFMKAHGVQRRR